MKIALTLFFCLAPVCLVLGGCSTSSREEVSLKLIFAKADLIPSRPTPGTIASLPVSSAEMDCYLINVRGVEIPPRYQPGQLPAITSAACLGFGAISDTVSLQTATQDGVTLRIRPGPQRTIEIYGLAGAPGCGGRDLKDILATDSPTLHLLGKTVRDLAEDVQVAVASTYDPATTIDGFAQCRPIPLRPFVDGNTNNTVLAVTNVSDGSRDVIIGGSFTQVNGASAVRLARLNETGALNTGFNSALGIGVNGTVNVLAPSLNGATFIGGNFTDVSGSTFNRFARIMPTGAVDASIPAGAGFDSAVTAIAAPSVNSTNIYVAGSFANYAGNSVPNLVSLNRATGVLTTGFTATSSGINTISAIDVDPSGANLYVAGDGDGLVKLSAVNGGLDSTFASSFTPAPDADVYTVRVVPGDPSKVYIGGAFTTINGASQGHICRILNTGAIDPTFNVGSGFNAAVKSIVPAFDSTGDIYVLGSFTTYKSVPVPGMVRISSNGTLRLGFSIAVSGSISLLFAPQPRDLFEFSFYLGGSFSQINGVGRSFLARVSSNGTLN